MAYGLREDLHFALVQDRVVFLDLRRDRYFCLPSTMTAAFRTLVDDVGPDVEQAAMLKTLAERDILIDGAEGSAFRTASLAPPLGNVLPTRESPAELGAVGGALLAQYAVARRLQKHGVHSAVATLRKRYVGCQNDRGGGSIVQSVINAFAATNILYSPQNRCLLRALALAARLRACGVGAQLCIGVALPFAAHAWVQEGEIVLGDTWENAALYTPILVV